MFDNKHNPEDAHFDRRQRGFGAPRPRRDDPRGFRDLAGPMARHLREEMRRNMRHHGRGNPPFDLNELFGRGGPGGRGGRPGVRRGEVRTLILGALADRPMHGYEVIQALEDKSRGMWRPSAGSIYPTLQQLSDEGLITGEDVDGRRTYTLTDEGRKVVAENPAPTWDEADGTDTKAPDVMRLAMELAAAVVQVQRVGSARAKREATRILTDARKQMYRLLSEDEDAGTDDSTESTEGRGR
ncbi:MAG TPA: PadR family transcriptional regulator [Candidatus Limnocylindrales bacterium]|nr:PadR family transcriptional regulator [Candidatus Limnocylindrales bacterium]